MSDRFFAWAAFALVAIMTVVAHVYIDKPRPDVRCWIEDGSRTMICVGQKGRFPVRSGLGTVVETQKD